MEITEILTELQEIQRSLATKDEDLEMTVGARKGDIYYRLEYRNRTVTSGFFYAGPANRTQNRYGIYAFRQTVQKVLEDIKAKEEDE